MFRHSHLASKLSEYKRTDTTKYLKVTNGDIFSICLQLHFNRRREVIRYCKSFQMFDLLCLDIVLYLVSFKVAFISLSKLRLWKLKIHVSLSLTRCIVYKWVLNYLLCNRFSFLLLVNTRSSVAIINRYTRSLCLVLKHLSQREKMAFLVYAGKKAETYRTKCSW